MEGRGGGGAEGGGGGGGGGGAGRVWVLKLSACAIVESEDLGLKHIPQRLPSYHPLSNDPLPTHTHTNLLKYFTFHLETTEP